MNLITQERVIWTVPVPTRAKRLYNELRLLNAAQGSDEAREQRRQQILAELPDVTQYRLTLSGVTISEEGRRDALLRDVRTWFEQTHGLSLGEYNQWFLDTWIRQEKSQIDYPAGETLDKEQAGAIFATLQDIGNWATVMVCLRKVETRKAPMIDMDQGVWQETGIPAEWRDFHAFMEAFPRPLMRTCVEICHELNPGVWQMAMDEDSKNFGGVSVRG